MIERNQLKMQTTDREKQRTKESGISVVLATVTAGFLLHTVLAVYIYLFAENVLEDVHFTLDLFPSFPCFPPSAKRLMQSKITLH